MQDYAERNPDAGPLHWTHHTTLAFEAVKCKGRFVVNYHTNEVVGNANETLKLDVIMNELREMEAQNKEGNEVETNDQGKAKDPLLADLAKQF